MKSFHYVKQAAITNTFLNICWHYKNKLILPKISLHVYESISHIFICLPSPRLSFFHPSSHSLLLSTYWLSASTTNSTQTLLSHLLFDKNKLYLIFFQFIFWSYSWVSFVIRFRKKKVLKIVAFINNKKFNILVKHISSGRNKLFHKCEFFISIFQSFRFIFYYHCCL